MKRPIPTALRRGKDDRSDKERCRQRLRGLCPVCEILGVKKQGRRGWANGLCISCARCNGCMEPRKSRNRRHHKKEMPSEKKPKEKKPKVKKEPKEKKPNHYPKDSVASRHQDRDNMSEGLNANVKVKKEPKVIAEGTITKGADEGAAGCSITKRLKRLTRCGCPFHGKENFGEDIGVI